MYQYLKTTKMEQKFMFRKLKYVFVKGLIQMYRMDKLAYEIKRFKKK